MELLSFARDLQIPKTKTTTLDSGLNSEHPRIQTLKDIFVIL